MTVTEIWVGAAISAVATKQLVNLPAETVVYRCQPPNRLFNRLLSSTEAERPAAMFCQNQRD
jgi:hypothetical protein